MRQVSSCFLGLLMMTTVLLVGCGGGGKGLPSPGGREAIVQGTVSDAQGRLLSSVFVFAFVGEQPFTTSTDPNGFFTLTIPITQPTTVTITASFGGQTATRQVTVSPGQTVTVNLTLGAPFGGPPGPGDGGGVTPGDGPPPPPPL